MHCTAPAEAITTIDGASEAVEGLARRVGDRLGRPVPRPDGGAGPRRPAPERGALRVLLAR